MNRKKTNWSFPLLTLFCLSLAQVQAAENRWTEARANEWHDKQPWLVGCNFSPSAAINQLEMWQADTFDLRGIDRELGWADRLDFNCARVFLHDLAWKQDAEGFFKRMEQFLTIANRHNIKIVFVFFDSCWDPYPKSGQQREPKPHVHNSGWVQSPGLDILTKLNRHDELEPYVKAVLQKFRDDRRILAWDLFNEPDNTNNSSYSQYEPPNKSELALALLEKVFAWAREVNPSQPLTVGVWTGEWEGDRMSAVNRFSIENSDIVSFHNYSPLPDMKARVASLKKYNRPLICTEYMARPAGSTFKEIMPFLKDQKIGAINWGFVSGKTQTIYPWDSWKKAYTAEPPLWFHDIFRKDGSAYDPKEVMLIKTLTGQIRSSSIQN